MKKATSLSQLAFQKFCKNFWGMLSVAFLTLAVMVAIFAYGLAPDNSENANQMHLSIHSESPGFEVDLLLIDNSTNYEQNLFEKLFFGDKNPPLEIPLQQYVFRIRLLLKRHFLRIRVPLNQYIFGFAFCQGGKCFGYVLFRYESGSV